MNCENCQELIHDLLDGTLSGQQQLALNAHLSECLDCANVRQDLESILGFCRDHRGEYEAPPNEKAMWLRIRNVIEAKNGALQATPARRSLFGWLNRSWELSLPQLAGLAAAIVLCVSLATAVGLRRLESTSTQTTPRTLEASAVSDRVWQQQQVVNYWNQRIEVNKVRWSPEMRQTFDRNLAVIDQAVNDSLNELHRNPHDDLSEQMLNDAMNDKVALLKEFSDL
ncbi:MAG TPA: zf-HC2 domain-containing protein [Pyrinomonadaceae bacterium]|nr:zf-HC2 domain-containing protein [Pyrinomonadaceae bacterium]